MQGFFRAKHAVAIQERPSLIGDAVETLFGNPVAI